MKTFNDIEEIIDQISYKDWNFVLVEYKSCMYLQVQFEQQDNTVRHHCIERQHGRKWLISPHMTRSEIVQTALKAVLTAEEYEAREKFTYKGCTPFAPHFDVDLLCSLASIPEKDNLDLRPPVDVVEISEPGAEDDPFRSRYNAMD